MTVVRAVHAPLLLPELLPLLDPELLPELLPLLEPELLPELLPLLDPELLPELPPLLEPELLPLLDPELLDAEPSGAPTCSSSRVMVRPPHPAVTLHPTAPASAAVMPSALAARFVTAFLMMAELKHRLSRGATGSACRPPAATAMSCYLGGRVARVLLIEDSSRVAETVGAGMRAMVIPWWSRRAACAPTRRLARDAFDVAVVDIGLPDGSGLDWCRAARLADNSTAHSRALGPQRLADRVTASMLAQTTTWEAVRIEELLARVRALCRRGPRWAESVRVYGRVRVDGDRPPRSRWMARGCP